jgi:hypothetical protein
LSLTILLDIRPICAVYSDKLKKQKLVSFRVKTMVRKKKVKKEPRL